MATHPIELRRPRGTGVLVAALILVAVATVILVDQLTGRLGLSLILGRQLDWIHEHHRILVVMVPCAALGVSASAAVAGTKSSGRAQAWAAAALAAAVFALGAWVGADRHSNIGDIAGRVGDVAALLPRPATITSSHHDDNLVEESYRIAADPSSVSASLSSSRLVSTDSVEAARPAHFSASFTGRNGCDGQVEIGVEFLPSASGTVARLTGSCND
jgi:hypothetical protein